MKKLIFALCALFASTAFATTYVPVQLLNPTGSSSGQAIVSTGSSSAPAWGGIGVNGIAAIAANTVLANATGSSAAPTAFAVPSCSTSASALNWTTSTGFTCNTAVNAAQLAGQTFTSPTITTPNIVGVSNGSSASAGSVGEEPNATGTAVSITTATLTNIASISLTAGDWDIYASVQFNPAGSTVMSTQIGGISSTSATLPASPLFTSFNSVTTAAGVGQAFAVPSTTLNVSSTTTVYLVAYASFTTSTCTVTGKIWARRRH